MATSIDSGKHMIPFMTRLIFMSTDFRMREETILRCLIRLLEICTEEEYNTSPLFVKWVEDLFILEQK